MYCVQQEKDLGFGALSHTKLYLEKVSNFFNYFIVLQTIIPVYITKQNHRSTAS